MDDESKITVGVSSAVLGFWLFFDQDFSDWNLVFYAVGPLLVLLIASAGFGLAWFYVYDEHLRDSRVKLAFTSGCLAAVVSLGSLNLALTSDQAAKSAIFSEPWMLLAALGAGAVWGGLRYALTPASS